MDMIDWIFIVLSAVFIMLSYVVKKKTLYILFQTISNAILVVNYVYVQSISSAISIGIATVRFIVYCILVGKYDDIPWWVIIAFTLAVGCFGVCTAKQSIDYLLIVAVMIYSICYKIKELILMKIALLLPLTMLFVYAIIVEAYSGIIGQGFEVVVVAVQAIRFAISKRKKGKENQQTAEQVFAE